MDRQRRMEKENQTLVKERFENIDILWINYNNIYYYYYYYYRSVEGDSGHEEIVGITTVNMDCLDTITCYTTET